MGIILDKLDDSFLVQANQPYLNKLFKALTVMAYYGLMRVGELTDTSPDISNHTIRFIDVHLARNKRKVLILLRMSKTHSIYQAPQIVKINGVDPDEVKFGSSLAHCPYRIIDEYLDACGDNRSVDGPFFIFRM